MKRLLLAAVALCCASVSAQTIPVYQLRPSTTNGQVVTTVGGQTQWATPPTPGGGSAGSAGTIQAASATSGLFAAATAGNVMTTLGSPVGIVGIGDSIIYSTGATTDANGYFRLMKNSVGGLWQRLGQSGDENLDANMYIMSATLPVVGGPNYLLEIGTNDVNASNGGTTNYQNTVKRIYLDNALWLTIPFPNKVYAQSCPTTGSWTNDIVYGPLAKSTVFNGSTMTCTVIAGPNGNVALGYLIANTNGGTFTVTANGTPENDPYNGTTTWYAEGDGGTTISTRNGQVSGVAGAVLTGFTPNATVNIVFTVTSASSGSNIVEPVWVASMPAASINNPWMESVSPNHQNNANDALSGTYAGFESAIVTQLAGYGLNAYTSDTRDALLNSPSCGNGSLSTMYSVCYYDTIHPNNTGHELMASTNLATMTAANPALISNAPTNLLQGSNSVYNPGPYRSPADFFDVNPYNLSQTSPNWGGGILLSKLGGYVSFITFLPGLGPALVGTQGVTGSYLCQGPNQRNYGFSPSAVVCGMGVAYSGISEMGIDPANLSQFAMGGYQGNAYTGLGSAYAGSTHSFFINTQTNFLNPLAIASSTQNQPSAVLYGTASVWVSTAGGEPGITSIGFNTVPNAGTNPTLYYRMSTINPTGLPYGFDISSATTPNLLGDGLLKTVQTGTTSNTDLAGFITLVGGVGTYTFTETYTNGPVCNATDTTAVAATQASASATVLTVHGTGTDVLAYTCVKRN